MKLKMTIDEALEFADEWSRGMTIHEGSQGWRVVCMLLAEEVRRREAMDFAHVWDQIEHDLGFNEHNMQRDRPYNGQPHTCTGERGATEIRGVTFRDLRDCFIRAFILSHEHYKAGTLVEMQPNAALRNEAEKGEAAALCENDIYGLVGGIDPMAVAKNLACEVEKAMGIYPNVPRKGTT